MRQQSLLLAAFVGAAIAAGCTGGGDGATKDGGFVLVDHTSGFVYGLFLADAENAESSLTKDQPIDVCETPGPPPAVTPVFTYLDVGETVTITGGANPVVLDRFDDGSLIDYTGGFAAQEDVPLDTSFDVALSGQGDVAPTTWSDALHVPAQIVVSAPSMAGPVALSGDLPVSWTPTGASVVLISFSGAGGGGFCLVDDDGSFTVPASHIALMPTAGTLYITNVDANVVDLGGRGVDLIGTTAVGTAFTNP